MRLLLKIAAFCAVLYIFAFCAGLVADKTQLKNELIRVHIVANSDSPEDQAVKQKVKDKIVAYLQPAMQGIASKEEAFSYIRTHLQKLEDTANEVLRELGESKTATVSLTQEEFGERNYDTFSLPSGVYDALRVVIGDGAGQNWWCVAFPSLCMPATTDEFTDVAAASGFSDTLTKTVTEKGGYEIRFFFLDLFGKVENFFH